MPEHTNSQHVRRVTLPSGRKIEVVYFENEHTRAADHADCELHRCGTCNSELVHPVEWMPVGRNFWQITLRCPNCEWTGTGVFDQDTVDRFDAELGRGVEALHEASRRVSLENMAEEIERFIRALDADQVLPSDF